MPSYSASPVRRAQLHIARSGQLLILPVLLGACAVHVPRDVREAATPDRPATVALTNVRIVDGTGRPSSARPMTVEISERRITAIYPTRDATRPTAAIVHVLDGRYVMPGLFDSHVHLTMGGRPAPALQLRLVLEGGVTSVRDMAGHVPLLRTMAERSGLDTANAPRIHYSALVAGPSWFDDARARTWTDTYPLGAAPWQHAITDTSDVRAIVAGAKATGAAGLKIYANLHPTLVRSLADEARRQGMRVWAHSTVFPTSPSQVIAAGVHTVSHATYAVWEDASVMPTESRGTLNASDFSGDPTRSPRIREYLAAMKRRGTFLDATMSLLLVRMDTKGALGKNPEQTVAWTRALTREAHRAGVRFVAGTDAMGPGRDSVPILHYELEELVTHAGLTPAEAIESATRNAAEALGIEQDFGTVEVGRVADVLVLAADPTVDVRNTRRPLMVFKGGALVHQRPVATTMPDGSRPGSTNKMSVGARP